MRSSEHQIDCLRLLLKAKNRGITIQWQQDFSFLLHMPSFLQQLEAMLNRLTPNGEYVELPSLRLSFQCADPAKMQALFLAELEKMLAQNIRRPADQNMLQLTGTAFALKVLRDFLLYGTILHPGGGEIIIDVVNRVRAVATKEDPPVEAVIVETLRISSAATQRLLLLVGEASLRQIFCRLFHLPENFLESLEDRDSTPAHFVSALKTMRLGTAAFWQTALRLIENGNILTPVQNESAVDVLLAKNPGITSRELHDRLPMTDELFQTLPSNAIIPIENAGLVLLWMIFRKLFEGCGYVEQRRFVNEEKQQEAILLTQYIVRGKTMHEEYELPLNKLLCSWPLHKPIDLSLLPSEEAVKAADAAFDEFVVSWRGDKKYSFAWFRSAFLLRRGELKFLNNGNLQLVVDRRTEDVLLSPVTVIRLPWMNNLVFVQW